MRGTTKYDDTFDEDKSRLVTEKQHVALRQEQEDVDRETCLEEFQDFLKSMAEQGEFHFLRPETEEVPQVTSRITEP